jgi:hypothetical protein
MKIERVVPVLGQLMDKESEKRGFAQAGLPDDKGNVALLLKELGAALLRRPLLTVSFSLYCFILANFPYLITFR